MKKLTALIIMDGFGIAKPSKGNAISLIGTPNLEALSREYPSTTLSASGRAVGLPKGQIGNSEVGHLNIGAGRVVYQDITMIDKAIEDGDFYKNPAFLSAIENVKKSKSRLHLYGLTSDGGVHSHLNHLFALLSLAKQQGLSGSDVCIHCLMDGRDVSPTSGAGYVKAVLAKCAELGVGVIASVMGRYYLMDRDNRWERVERGFNCFTAGVGDHTKDPIKLLEDSYAKGVTDEFIEPTAVLLNGKPIGVNADDSVIMFNFRSDRAREVTRAFIEKDFAEFKRAKGYIPVTYVGFTQYDAAFKGLYTAFPPKSLKNTLGEFLADNDYTQVRIAETEKYAHVTFFFNGGVEQPNKGESRVLVASPKVATYDLQPEMSAIEVTNRAISEIQSGKHDVMILNLANCDMVGHTGSIPATEKAVSTVDDCVGRLVSQILAAGGRCLITADHGNAEQMLYEDGSVCTAHTTNPVPLILVDDSRKSATLQEGSLCDIAPTMLYLMGVTPPAEMEGKILIK